MVNNYNPNQPSLVRQVMLNTNNIDILNNEINDINQNFTDIREQIDTVEIQSNLLVDEVNNINDDLNNKANLYSPNFTGVVTAPTPDLDNSNNIVATTKFVKDYAQILKPYVLYDRTPVTANSYVTLKDYYDNYKKLVFIVSYMGYWYNNLTIDSEQIAFLGEHFTSTTTAIHTGSGLDVYEYKWGIKMDEINPNAAKFLNVALIHYTAPSTVTITPDNSDLRLASVIGYK